MHSVRPRWLDCCVAFVSNVHIAEIQFRLRSGERAWTWKLLNPKMRVFGQELSKRVAVRHPVNASRCLGFAAKRIWRNGAASKLKRLSGSPLALNRHCKQVPQYSGRLCNGRRLQPEG